MSSFSTKKTLEWRTFTLKPGRTGGFPWTKPLGSWQAGKSVHSQIELTRREEEVLAGLMNSLANKEIAANLNLSERTVKFHVSSLLAKFRVRGRMELVREASRQSAGTMVMPMPVAASEGQSYAAPAKSYSAPRPAAAVVPLAKRQLMA